VSHQSERLASELRDTNARLQTIIDSAVDGIIVIDSAGVVESFNRGAERLFGYPASEVVGRNVSILMPSPEHEEHDGYLERYLTTGHAKIIGTGREVPDPGPHPFVELEPGVRRALVALAGSGSRVVNPRIASEKRWLGP